MVLYLQTLLRIMRTATMAADLLAKEDAGLLGGRLGRKPHARRSGSRAHGGPRPAPARPPVRSGGEVASAPRRRGRSMASGGCGVVPTAPWEGGGTKQDLEVPAARDAPPGAWPRAPGFALASAFAPSSPSPPCETPALDGRAGRRQPLEPPPRVAAPLASASPSFGAEIRKPVFTEPKASVVYH